MSQGALLQILLVGDEDVTIHSSDETALKPYRQVFKKVTPYAVASIDLGVSMQSSVTYGQTYRFHIPRKGDLLQSLTLRMQVKKTSETSYFPAEDLIETVSLVMGKQTIDEFSGEYIRLHGLLHDTPDAAIARRRLSDFDSEDQQGVVRVLYVDIPFYFSQPGCCLPLIALQYMQPEVVIQFKSSVVGLDPTHEPDISVSGEYVFLDDTEREWWTKDEHSMLIPYIRSYEDRVDIESTKLYVSNTPNGNQIALPQAITGTASDRPQEDVITVRGGGQESYITLVNDIFPGESSILYDGGLNASVFRVNASLMVPTDAATNGRIGVVWAKTETVDGYVLEFRFNTSRVNDVDVNLYRNNVLIVALTSVDAYTANMTGVNADSSSFDVRSQTFIDTYGDLDVNTNTNPQYETWVTVDMNHSLTGVSTMSMTYSIEVYERGANSKINNGSAVSSKSKFLTVTEGYSAINTIGVQSQFGFVANSTVGTGIVTDVDIGTSQQFISPTDENLTVKKTRLFNQGPIRYMFWVTTPLSDSWAEFSTGSKGNTTLRYDPLEQAQILINGKPRTDLEDTRFFTVYHPSRVLGRSLPSGVHLYSFSKDIRTFQPSAALNFSRTGDVTLLQRYRKYNPSASTLADLRDSESLPRAKDFKRIQVYLVGYNVLRIVDGTMALWRV